MQTEIGVQLTEKEIKLVKSLERLDKRWQRDGGRLWLFSASGLLHVMLCGDIPSNPEPTMLPVTLGVNPKNSVITVDIPNDGGDW